ncbi:MAG TPA: FtsW/RodA/SpoVE family cell cycle protein, partial [Polyangiaceae bacterium]|nr:FtsW/RodA/SpoVE family cell cycle protein [Polyangiaceae bacterium]
MKSVQDLLAHNKRRGPMDVVLAAAAIALLGFGVVMVYSASIIEATTAFRNPQYFLIRQAIFAGTGLAIILTVSRIDVHKLKPFTYPILGVVTFLMVLSVIGFGHTGGGAARWLTLGPIHIQPSEAAKLALILWLAYSLEKKRERMKSFSIGMLPHFLMAGLLMVLCLKQPDFGGAVVLLFLTFALLFVAGARLGYLLGAALVGTMFAAWAVRFTSYRWVRIIAWSNMGEHRQDLAYQPFQSVMSF